MARSKDLGPYSKTSRGVPVVEGRDFELWGPKVPPKKCQPHFFSETFFRTNSFLIAIDAVQRDLKTSAGALVEKSIFWGRGAPKHYNELKLRRALADEPLDIQTSSL